MDEQRVHVIVVDDNSVVVERLVSLLHEEPRIVVCDRVESGLLAFARVAARRPDIVLMDLEMPGIGGIAAIKRIKDLVGPPRIVVVTMHDGEEMRAQAVRAGADAFISKSRVGQELLPTVRALFPDSLSEGSAVA